MAHPRLHLLLLALVACHANDDGPAAADTDLPADTDTDTDADTDADADTDTDADTDADTDTHTDTGPLAVGEACDPGADRCGEGAACCTACCATNAVPLCAELDVSGACPLPDLSIDADTLASSAYVSSDEFEADDCAVEEACVSGTGWRRLLRFTTKTDNLGTADLVLGMPSEDPDRFEWSACHSHYHMSGYMEYALLDAGGTEVATGRKQAFCLMDTEPAVETPGPLHYHCGDQGISVGWADTYVAWLDCQWLDVTELPDGDYTLRLTVDPDAMLRETDTTNNRVELAVTLADTVVTDTCDPVALGEDRDCGWSDAGTFACTPGDAVTLACDGACEGGCEGDPVLRVCDATTPGCTATEAIGSNDDASCGSACSSLSFTCPDGGSVQALTGAWASDGEASCDVVAL